MFKNIIVLRIKFRRITPFRNILCQGVELCMWDPSDINIFNLAIKIIFSTKFEINLTFYEK